MRGVFFAVLLMLSLTSMASDSLSVQYGVAHGDDTFLTDKSRSISLNHTGRLRRLVSRNVSIGFFSDSREDLTTLFTAYQLGTIMRPQSWSYVSVFFGPGLVSKTGSRLSGTLQFFHDLCTGFSGEAKEFKYGLCWKHISNAGMDKPNKGRDFILLKADWGL